MSNIAAIRWLPQGKEKPPLIQYMLINSVLDYLISPTEISVTDLKKNINDLFIHIDKFSQPNIPLIVHYKSITKSFGKHRRDSAKFHKLINKILRKRKLLKANSRTISLLKRENLTLFKDALYFLDIDCKTKGCAFIAHLWTIALKATNKRFPQVIKQIWKSKYGITRITKDSSIKFSEFYAHFL
ncbi:TPA: hypothetical protein ACPSKB_002352 [Legionella feeleii]